MPIVCQTLVQGFHLNIFMKEVPSSIFFIIMANLSLTCDVKAVEAAVRLADELRQPSQATTPRSGEILHQRSNPLTSGFKR
jgi:hypothetical protein